jgi:hypothetical protein
LLCIRPWLPSLLLQEGRAPVILYKTPSRATTTYMHIS